MFFFNCGHGNVHVYRIFENPDFYNVISIIGRMDKVVPACISAARKCKIDAVVSMRTTRIAVLLEDVHDRGNENAIIRTMDAFGFQNLHVVSTMAPRETRSSRKIQRTDKGARKWVTIHNWNCLDQCVAHLRSQGYMIATTHPGSGTGIQRVNFNDKLVLAFGNEQLGISQKLAQLSDFNFSIPMCGFVESLNVSVAVAVTLFQAFAQRMDRVRTLSF